MENLILDAIVEPNYDAIKKTLNNYLIGRINKDFDTCVDAEPIWEEDWRECEIVGNLYQCVEYLAWSFNCFMNYTRSSTIKTIKTVREHNLQVNSVADIGAGIGLSTLLMNLNMPDCKKFVYEDTSYEQKKFFETHILPFKSTSLITVTDKRKDVGHVDLLCAFEFFEHFSYPIIMLESLLVHIEPKYLSISNAFGQDKCGHYSSYTVCDCNDEVSVHRRDISKVFDTWLRDNGWSILKRDGEEERAKPRVWAKL